MSAVRPLSASEVPKRRDLRMPTVNPFLEARVGWLRASFLGANSRPKGPQITGLCWVPVLLHPYAHFQYFQINDKHNIEP